MITLSTAEARQRFTELSYILEDQGEDAVCVTRHGRPSLAVLDWQSYEAIKESLTILGTEGLRTAFFEGHENIQRGATTSWATLRPELQPNAEVVDPTTIILSEQARRQVLATKGNPALCRHICDHIDTLQYNCDFGTPLAHVLTEYYSRRILSFPIYHLVYKPCFDHELTKVVSLDIVSLAQLGI